MTALPEFGDLTSFCNHHGLVAATDGAAEAGRARSFSRPQTRSDGEVLAAGRAGSNGGKFIELEAGRHNGLSIGDSAFDHSAADLAFGNFLWFHSRNAEQVVRIWQASVLGQREKAHRPDYIERTLDKAADQEFEVLDNATLIEAGREKLAMTQPVDIFRQLQPAPVPTGVLPRGIEYLAEAMAAEIGCDPAGVAGAMLGAIAGVIPDRIKIQVKSNWRERACIWPMLVGDPSTKKTPIIRAATSPIVKEDLRRFKIWQRTEAEWQALDKESQKAIPRPVMSRLMIGDATTEAAQEALRANPNGLFHATSEASGWLASMERNGKASGVDRAFWLQAYDGGEFAFNRVGRGAVVIENLSIGLIGAIQPDKIREAVNGAADDGLIQRTMPIILRPATMSAEDDESDINVKNAEAYGRLIENCATFDFGITLIPLSPGAKIIRRRVERRVHEMQSLEVISRKLASHVGKYEGLFARLCLVFHVADYVSRTMLKERVDYQEIILISEDCARRVEIFIFDFLLPHAASFYQNVVGGLDDKDALESLANYILAHGLTEIDNRTVARGDRSLRKLSNFQVAPLFEQLTALGWIEPVEGPQKRSSKHVVNPQVHVLFAERARIEADRRAQAKVALAAIFGPTASRDNGDKP